MKRYLKPLAIVLMIISVGGTLWLIASERSHAGPGADARLLCEQWARHDQATMNLGQFKSLTFFPDSLSPLKEERWEEALGKVMIPTRLSGKGVLQNKDTLPVGICWSCYLNNKAQPVYVTVEEELNETPPTAPQTVCAAGQPSPQKTLACLQATLAQEIHRLEDLSTQLASRPGAGVQWVKNHALRQTLLQSECALRTHTNPDKGTPLIRQNSPAWLACQIDHVRAEIMEGQRLLTQSNS